MVRHMFSNLLLLWSLSHELYATGLTDVDSKEQSWNGHNLSAVPVELDIRLRRLDLSNNFIRQLHTLGLPYLEQLDLSNNQLDLISEGAFRDLDRLGELNLSRNALNNNPVRNGKALKSISSLRILDISENGLSDDAVLFYLQNKPSLSHLRLSSNAIKRLTVRLLKGSKGLKTIAIDDNLISVIERGTFETLSQLESLSLTKNYLPNICDFTLHQLQFLNLSHNSIQFFVTGESNDLYRLEILDLSHNQLLYFPVVPNTNRLKYLFLQHNMIGALQSEATMVSEANFLYNEIIRRGNVRVTKNYLHANWRLMPLVHIDLSYNHFRSFPLETLSRLSSLETLKFSHNCLQNIIWDVRNDSESGSYRRLLFSSVKRLELQSNGLGSISPLFLQTLTHLEDLNLQDNSIKPCAHVDLSFKSTLQKRFDGSCIAFEKLGTLKHLNLKGNNIKLLYAKSFKKTSLVSLNLAGNLHMIMRDGALEGVQETLQSLTISDLNITSSELLLPTDMPVLTQLDMSNNRLNVIPSSLTHSPLREINIKNNAFESLNHSLIAALSSHLNTMYISGNYFNCCDNKWLTVINVQQIELPDISLAECFTGVSNVPITKYLNETSMKCVFSTKAREENHSRQMIVIVLFLLVLFTSLIVLIRKACCMQRSFIV